MYANVYAKVGRSDCQNSEMAYVVSRLHTQPTCWPAALLLVGARECNLSDMTDLCAVNDVVVWLLGVTNHSCTPSSGFCCPVLPCAAVSSTVAIPNGLICSIAKG